MRGWHELVAAVGDRVPGGVPVLGLGLLLVTTIGATLWYWWPDWLPQRRRQAARSGRAGGRRRWRLGWPGWLRWSRWRLRWSRWRLRWSWRWRRRGAAEQRSDLAPDGELPEVPAAVLALSADELAAQGRYREAVRERLRAIVRDLVDRGVVANRPGWTVIELAGAAGQARPVVGGPLAGAGDVFSGIWYGQRPARAADDAAMRDYAGQVRAALDRSQVEV